METKIHNDWFLCPYCGKQLVTMGKHPIGKDIFIKCKGTRDKKCSKIVELLI